MDFDYACQTLRSNGFLRVKHPVVIHHNRKDYTDYTIAKDAYYIKPIGDDFIHVAVIYTVAHGTWINYCYAADDLLYGIYLKFRKGIDQPPKKVLDQLISVCHEPALPSKGAGYIKQRFNKQGRQHAKIRACLIFIKETLKNILTFK